MSRDCASHSLRLLEKVEQCGKWHVNCSLGIIPSCSTCVHMPAPTRTRVEAPRPGFGRPKFRPRIVMTLLPSRGQSVVIAGLPGCTAQPLILAMLGMA